MLGIGDLVPEFEIVGVKPKFMKHEENGQSAFETITQESFPDKWKVFYFYPKDFTFVCPTEIVEYAKLNKDFEDRDCVLLGGSTDNEFCKLAWRREHNDVLAFVKNLVWRTAQRLLWTLIMLFSTSR
jgi:alkyl hydroperoxide reductase subunit AhpC